jgi:hypothetical protein
MRLQTTKRIHILPLLLLVCVAVLGVLGAPRMARAAETTLEYPLYQLPVAPVLDGEIENDPAWQGVPEASGFFRLGGGYARAKQTQIRAAWHGDTIYLAVRAEEPDIAGITPQGGDGGDLWSEDGIEIFVRPTGVSDFYQFILNSGGARRGAGLAEGHLDWQAKAGRTADAYTLEIALPFTLFGKKPAPGAVWRGNFARNIFTTTSGGDKFTTWAPLKSSFHEWDRFARWKFLDAAPNAAELATTEAKLNGVYLDFLRAEINKSAQQSAQYLPVLQRAAKQPQFAERATALIAKWNDTERVQSLGPLAPAIELRHAVANGEKLLDDSKQLKYDFLFWELFNS